MNITARQLTQQRDGVRGWIAHPNSPGRRPAIMMLHHAYGLTGEYKIDASLLAQLGFTVLVPNLYNMLGEPGSQHIETGPQIVAKNSDADFLRVTRDAWGLLMERPDSNPERTALVGHCLGGRLAMLFAADTPSLSALVLYYPTIIDASVSEMRPRHSFDAAKLIKSATLVIYGGRDRLTSNKNQLQLWQSFLAGGAALEWHFFSQGKHGFAGAGSDEYQPQHAQLAWPLTTNFLLRTLCDGVTLRECA